MARGWESKSVDEQMAEAERAREEVAPPPSAEERERAARLEALTLDRARTLQQLQTACDRRYRAQLEAALAHLDAAIAGLERAGAGDPAKPTQT
ncbi:MAG: hypothetical protein DIU54_009695 [Acidobacteriota bacterium]|jgi:hypothetical protein|nr:MAG: hypothetical protein DIU54_07520 [Acidobacteriota bacterium]